MSALADAVGGLDGNQVVIRPYFLASVQTVHRGELGLALIAEGGSQLKQLIILKTAYPNGSYRGGLSGGLYHVISAGGLRREVPVFYCSAIPEIGAAVKISVSERGEKSLSDLAEELYSEGMRAGPDMSFVHAKHIEASRNLFLEAFPLFGRLIAFFNEQKRLSERLRQEGWTRRAEPVRLYLQDYPF